MELIDKATLVAKIENLESNAILEYNSSKSRYSEGCLDVIHQLKSFLNIIKSKEVDLDKEIDKWYNNKASEEFENIFYEDIEKCAKYFFELGLKAQKGK